MGGGLLRLARDMPAFLRCRKVIPNSILLNKHSRNGPGANLQCEGGGQGKREGQKRYQVVEATNLDSAPRHKRNEKREGLEEGRRDDFLEKKRWLFFFSNE